MDALGTWLPYVADILHKSGVVGLITLVIFFVCVGIGFERLIFWTGLWGWARLLGLRTEAGVRRQARKVEKYLAAGRFARAAVEAGRAADPALRLLGDALGSLQNARAWASVRDRSLAETLGGNAVYGQRFLITAIQGFGLLGMLGTCKGLYAQLSSVGANTADMANQLQGAMSGMGEAFCTTLVGLTAAALTTLIYLPNEMVLDRFRRQVRRFDSMIQAALTENLTSGSPKLKPKHSAEEAA
jgi:biopolymer transport protein ExbB/TolQ